LKNLRVIFFNFAVIELIR